MSEIAIQMREKKTGKFSGQIRFKNIEDAILQLEIWRGTTTT